MSETIDKLAKQHEIIGIKTNCKYFSNIGNLCSRVENGMMRCDEYLECEFKYIDALKEENERLQAENERLNWLLKTKCQSEWERENEELKKENKENLHYLACMTEQRNKLKIALEEIRKIAEPRFVNGLNEEADLCNLAMDRIQNKINEVLK